MTGVVDFVKPPLHIAFVIATAVFTLVSEDVFNPSCYGIKFLGGWGTTIGRVAVLLVTVLITIAAYTIFLWHRKSVILDDGECIIEVKYGDLLMEKDCKKVINFDESFTVRVGDAPEDIKETSICGQFLNSNPELDVAALVERSGIQPEPTPSRFGGRKRFAPGTIVADGDNLLVAFAKLNEDGRAEFTSREEYLACLSKLWKEIDKFSAQKDVCIPILGSGLTDFSGGSGKPFNQQELLDMIIWSYKLNACKIKRPQRLRIVCRKQSDFSLNKIKAR